MRVQGQDINIKGNLVRIASLSADTYEFVDNPVDTIEMLKKCQERIDLFTFMQRPSDALPKYSYPMDWDNLAVLSISSFDDWWNKQIGFKARNKAKQAEKKGVTIKEVPFSNELVRGIWNIYNESEIRQGRRFAHYGKDLETVYKMSSTFLDRSTFLGAYLDDHLIGFAKLHCDATRTQAGLAHILSLIEHRDKSPTNALVARAVRYCAENGIPNLVYSRFSDGNKQWDSLMEFKERNGFKRIALPRYYVPITYLGELSLQFGFHKRFIDRIPSPVFAALRNVRNFLYSKILHSSRGTQG